MLGFQVGSQWLYAPVFFVNGDLKGHELLYLKNEDRFVPLKENWVNDLLAKKPATLGRGVGRNTRELGVKYPDLFRALQSPHKYAAAADPEADRAALEAEAAPLRAKLAALPGYRPGTPDWAVVAVAALARKAARGGGRRLRLLDVVADGGLKAAADLKRTLDLYPTLRAPFRAAYDAEAARSAFAKAASARPAPPPRPGPAFVGDPAEALLDRARGRVQVFTAADLAKDAGWLLGDAEKAALVASGRLARDQRADDEVSTAYAVPTRVEIERRFQTPDAPGLYDVLLRGGATARCLVVPGPVGPAGREPWATIVRLEGPGGRSHVNAHPSYAFATARHPDWKPWFESLPGPGELRPGPGRYVLLAADGNATLPFRVVRSLGGDARGGACYEVDFDRSCRFPRAGLATSPGLAPYDPTDDGYEPWRDGQRVHVGTKGLSRIRAGRGDVYVPEGAKLLRLGGDDDGPEAAAAAAPLTPGDAVDVEAAIFGKFARLEVRARAGGYAVDGRDRGPADAAFAHLVAGVGLRAAAAEAVLKAADAARGGPATFLLKRAAPYQAYGGQPGGQADPYLTASGPSAPDLIDPMQGYDDVMGAAVPSQHALAESIRVEDLRADPRNRDAYDPASPDPWAVQVASDAAQKGYREVFDTAMVANLLRMSRDDQMVDKHIGTLLDGIDALGRMLMSFYWHGDEFAERYGDAEMPELEDAMRNTFEALGDLTLKIKQKSVEASPGEAAQDIDLGEAAGE